MKFPNRARNIDVKKVYEFNGLFLIIEMHREKVVRLLEIV